MNVIAIRRGLSCIFLQFTFAVSMVVCGQINSNESLNQSSKPSLIESITSFKSDQSSMIIDRWRREINRQEGSRGVVIIYCGQPCHYGEVEAHLRGIEFALDLKRMDRDSYTVISGWGFETTTTEFWIVPKGSCPPVPQNRVKWRDVKFRGSFSRKIIQYECCF